MVEQETLNTVFKSLSDPTRRDILSRLQQREHTISELVTRYDMSFAAVAKHVKVLESARLITKRRNGKEQVITINGNHFDMASNYLQGFAKQWSDRLDRLENELNKGDTNAIN